MRAGMGAMDVFSSDMIVKKIIELKKREYENRY
jgi:hypothetical protein